MSLNIPPEFERAVLERVESGAYESAAAVLSACLKALEAHEPIESADPDILRRQIEIGEESGWVDGEEAFARLRARFRRQAQP